MKLYRYILLLFSSLIFMSAVPPMPTIDGAMKQGNVNIISQYVDRSMSINIDNQSVNYSKSQATRVLEEFFDKNQPLSFEIKYRGNGDNNLIFQIGTLETKTGTFKVYMSFKNAQNTLHLQELRFQRS